MTGARTAFHDRYIPEPNSGCWLWLGAVNQYGYGRMYVAGRLILAHRFSFQKFKAELVEGFELDHICRVRCCVNPDHLEQVTHAVNVRRGGPRLHATCRNGHPWTDENTWRNPRNGWRQCRACNLANYYRMKSRRIAA